MDLERDEIQSAVRRPERGCLSSGNEVRDPALQQAKLRATFIRLKRWLKHRLKTVGGEGRGINRILMSQKFKLELKLLVHLESQTFSVMPVLIDAKTAAPLLIPQTDLDIQLETGVIMARERMLSPARLTDLIFLDLLKGLGWQNLSLDLLDSWTEQFFELKNKPPLRWPESNLNSGPALWSEVRQTPLPQIHLNRSAKRVDGILAATWRVSIAFLYGDLVVDARHPSPEILDSTTRTIHYRNLKFERQRLARCLPQLGSESGVESRLKILSKGTKSFQAELKSDAFARCLDQWLEEGLPVYVESKAVTRVRDGRLQMQTTPSGFELRGDLRFETHAPANEATAEPGAALAETFGSKPTDEHRVGVQEMAQRVDFDLGLTSLGEDHSGFLPPGWLARLRALSTLGRETNSAIFYQSAQGPLLAAILADSPASHDFDPPFAALVQRFIDHRELKMKSPPASFRGSLRHYQQEGLGWLSFLRETGFGGILADDMGLGKTVQVIAHLSEQYEREPGAPPSMVILPKSLLFNWHEEIAKFAPRLRAAIYESSQRRPLFTQLKDLQVLLITYNALRSDIESLREIEFHYVIADEAQAIKNPGSLIHRACLTIKARHRLAMSGTPVENSVQDLFAIFDFVSPGLIGTRLKQRALPTAAHGDLTNVAQALKPFVLRRTKGQVLKELPPKIEKVLYCKLSSPELKRYQQIRDHYAKTVQSAVAAKGLPNSGFVVLEGLLRLRQAASHAGLVHRDWLSQSSSKLDALMEQLEIVMAMGHKSLVFSQFTGLLDILETNLKKQPWRFARIDGSTPSARRQSQVRDFQQDPGLAIFLISLKAGGTGLNLTAADYVFILDPWWNPAAEAQAIDRAHRMGQKNQVMAYRLIAKGTVEEKIMALQQSKRDLAQALVAQDGQMLKSLSNDDIELLFS